MALETIIDFDRGPWPLPTAPATLAAMAVPRDRTELLTWRDAIDSKPDADITVLCFGADDDWFSGWWDGETWRDCASGAEVEGVMRWAEVRGPERSR